ncbi:MAG TPA: ACP phosphodiesterase [Rhodanobacteraceae bacterium]|nr:ACP phosphodiesterase [Rhodanobacteraceae bacterium]
MNHLAHALLADPGGPEFALGSSMGDFVHGHPDPAWPAQRQAGLRFHRAIDRFTDAHPEVVAARRAFESPLRRYAGIMLDVWFDHLLVRAWSHFNAEPLDAFAERWLALLDRRAGDLPPAEQRFVGFMHAHDLPAAYGSTATIADVMQGIAHRLSRPSPLADALPAIEAHAGTIERHFEAFFPDLVTRAQELRPRP